MDYPDPQLYVILAISVALLGITVSKSDVSISSTIYFVFPSFFVLCSWLHIMVSFCFSIEKLEPRDVIFHLFSLILFFVSLICIAYSLRDKADEKSLKVLMSPPTL